MDICKTHFIEYLTNMLDHDKLLPGDVYNIVEQSSDECSECEAEQEEGTPA